MKLVAALGISMLAALSAVGAESRSRYVINHRSLSERTPQCSQALMRLLALTIDRGQPRYQLDAPTAYTRLLRATRSPEAYVTALGEWFATPPPKLLENALFAAAVKKLQQPEIDADLFVCVLDGPCVIAGGAAALHVGEEYFHTRRFHDDPWPVKPATARRAPPYLSAQGMRGHFHMLVLKAPGPDQVITEKVIREDRGYVAHEALHAADYDFISDWILANYTLIAKGRAPDPRFLVVTREDPNGWLQVDEGFQSFVLESRGYSLSTFVDQFLTEPSEHAKAHEDFARLAVAQIRSDGGGYLLDELGASEKNIFAKGEEIAAIMAHYIELSREP